MEKLGDPNLDLMTGCDLGAYAEDLLNNLEKSHLTSQAFLKGFLQGKLKKGYEKLTKIINTFVAKTEAKGDSAFYKQHLEIYKTERNKIKEENYQLKCEIEKLQKEFYEFKNTHFIKSRTTRRSTELSPPNAEEIEVIPDVSHLVNQNDHSWNEIPKSFSALPPPIKRLPPVMRPPIQSKSTPIPEPMAQIPQTEAEYEVERINKQITALKSQEIECWKKQTESI